MYTVNETYILLWNNKLNTIVLIENTIKFSFYNQVNLSSEGFNMFLISIY